METSACVDEGIVLEAMFQRALLGKCIVGGCDAPSALSPGFLRLGEELKPAVVCTAHMIYGRETHNGKLEAGVWSCCRGHEVSVCNSFYALKNKLLSEYGSRIPITDKQRNIHKTEMDRLEQRIEAQFTSQNWDRS